MKIFSNIYKIKFAMSSQKRRIQSMAVLLLLAVAVVVVVPSAGVLPLKKSPLLHHRNQQQQRSHPLHHRPLHVKHLNLLPQTKIQTTVATKFLYLPLCLLLGVLVLTRASS
jgi:hypothetical protein